MNERLVKALDDMTYICVNGRTPTNETYIGEIILNEEGILEVKDELKGELEKKVRLYDATGQSFSSESKAGQIQMYNVNGKVPEVKDDLAILWFDTDIATLNPRDIRNLVRENRGIRAVFVDPRSELVHQSDFSYSFGMDYFNGGNV